MAPGQPPTAALTEPGAQLANPSTRSPTETESSGENPREQLELRLRIAWGDGPMRRWHGRIRLSSGNFSQLIPRGLLADSAAAGYLDQGELVIQQPTPRQHDAVDVTIRAPRTAELEVDLASGDEIPTGRRKSG
ncbi:MAG: hypothetical protein VB817_04875, partial [Pirellulaceae bacterium]